MIELALYQPDIPQNTGAAIRLCACLGIPLNIIEPCGFPWNEKKIRISAMDYIDTVELKRYAGWDKFKTAHDGRRFVLMTTKAGIAYTDFAFESGDVLIAGSESSGVPEEIHRQVDNHVKIEMKNGTRSLNVINASAMIIGEALRQVAMTL